MHCRIWPLCNRNLQDRAEAGLQTCIAGRRQLKFRARSQEDYAQLFAAASGASLRHAEVLSNRSQRWASRAGFQSWRESIVERARDAHAVVVDVAPVSLRELFLERVQDRK